jgi:hypothetical protein
MRPHSAPMIPSNRRTRFNVLNLISVATSVALICAALVVPILALAQGSLNEYGIPQVGVNAHLPTGQPSPTVILATMVNVVLGIVGTLAVVVVLYGGFLWMTAGGNEEHVKKAKELLGGAAVGLALIFASYAIASFVVRNISNNSGTVVGQGVEPMPGITCLAPNTCVPLNSCTGLISPGTCSSGNVCCAPAYTPPVIPQITCAQIGGHCFLDDGTQSGCTDWGGVPAFTGCPSGQYCCVGR